MAEQLTFDLPVKAALGREDFFVSPANALAVATLEGWQSWPNRKLALIGPKGAGKTHLTHVWASEAHATILKASDLPEADIPTLANAPVAVEDISKIAGARASEEALFHLHNLTLANGHALLMTDRDPPSRWPLVIADLKSRVEGTSVTTLDAPDDALLAALLVKLFADRQLTVQPPLITYLLRRMDRSFDAARALVEALDKAALAQKRPMTKALAAQLLDKAE